ncbi:MAG: GyrI-like domain-containing protein [Gammaproteobacteria bacterium]|nr:GyrI-like domain-containing protein [Gammaproteobacteria bacterium]MDH5727556.1 GyrI-like domain-containing protein [Gammaproteobacteria bacterium]
MKLKHFDEKTITGLTIRTNNELEMNPATGKIPGLYAQFDETIMVNYQAGEKVFGIYHNYESDHTGEFDVMAGFDGEVNSTDARLKQIVIPGGEYLVFQQSGEMPQCVIQAWQQVWDYFADAESEHRRAFSIDFEFYKSENEVEVYIAIV